MDKVICFDLGWTLEDETEAQIDRANKTAEILRTNQYNVDGNTLIEFQFEAGKMGIASVNTFAINKVCKEENIKAMIKEKVKWDSNLCKVYPAALQVLDKLNTQHKIVLICNQSKPVDERLEKYKIKKYFDKIICSCEVGLEKPNAEIFKLAEAYYGMDKEYWMIGDRVDNDIIPCKKLGWKTVRIKYGSHKEYKEKSVNEKATYTLRELEDVLRIKEISI